MEEVRNDVVPQNVETVEQSTEVTPQVVQSTPIEDEPLLKKTKTDAEMETIEPPVTSLKKTCPFVVVEHNYSGSQKDGFTKGEVEWAIWDSDSVVKDERGAFTYEYIEHHEEHALILEGNAVLVPKNGGESYENIPVSKGDYCIFKKGFLCEWQIVQRIRKRYCFFDEKGEMVVAGEKIACDLCGRDCTDESAGARKIGADEDAIEDLCLPCYRLYKDSYAGDGEHLVNGTVVGDLSTITIVEMKRKLDDVY